MLRFDVGEDLLHYYCNVDRVTVYATAPVNVAVGARILRQIGAGARDGGNQAPDRLSSLRRAMAQQSAGPSRYPVPDMPSIAVLPFQSMSADGMVEDIITGLSRILRLFVIARNSMLTYKGQAVDVKRVGRELGVRYVLSNRPQT
jgi:hypothetical protein